MRLRRKLHGLSVNATAGATARDYFSLFQLEPDFALDETALEQAYHALLTQFHPDRYAGKPHVEQRVSAATGSSPTKSPVPNTCCNKQVLIWSRRNARVLNLLF